MEKEGFSITGVSNTFFKGMIEMKKLTTLLLAAGMIFAASAPASAVDVKMDGQYLFSFITGENIASGKNFDRTGQRMRLGMTFSASENLSGYLQLQTGIAQDTNSGYDWGTDTTGRNSSIAVRQAYMDWMIPQTPVKIRMGKQLIGLPMDAFGKNAIMTPGWGGRDGLVVTAPATDWLDLTAFWVRGAYNDLKTGNDTVRSQKSDYFAAIAAFKFDGFSFTPYVMYGALDKGANVGASSDASTAFIDGKPVTVSADANAYWFGTNFVMSYFDPFTLKVSGAYGMANYEGADAPNDRDGWYIQAKASYKTAYGTPILGAWYGSGDDSDVQYARQGWIPTNVGRFHPTFAYCSGEFGLYDNNTRHAIAGTWGVQAGIEDVSFIEDLTHKFTVTLWKGTNSDKLSGNYEAIEYMTTSDAAVEFNLANTYKIYKNLTAVLELAYIINDFDYNDHAGKYASKSDMDKDSWSTALTFEYKF